MNSSTNSEDESPPLEGVTYEKPARSGDEDDPDRAVALEYDEEEDQAPKVTAKGEGEIARKILELAEREDIPLYEDEDLVELLYQLDLDQEIPTGLYEVVAEVFAFLYRLNEEEANEPTESP